MQIDLSEKNLDILIELLEQEIRYLERKERIVTGDELKQLKVRLLMHLYPMVITFNLVKLKYSKDVNLSDDKLSDTINDKLILQSLQSKLNDAINR